MSLWAKTQQLPPESLQQILANYEDNLFPMEVRHCLAQYIEEKFWSQHELSVAGLVNSLIQEMENEAAVVNDSLTKSKLAEAAKMFRERYSANPMQLFKYVRQCLETEMRLVQASNGEALSGIANLIISDSGTEILREIDLKRRTQDTADVLRRMQQEQEAFALQYHEYNTKINAHMQQLLLINQLQSSILDNELKSLEREQQLAGNNRIQKRCDIDSIKNIVQMLEDDMNEFLQKPINTSTPMTRNRKLSFSLKNELTFSPIIKKYENESRAVNSNNSKDHYINSVITFSSLIDNDEEINKTQHNILVSELNSPKETEAGHFSVTNKKGVTQETDNFDSYLNEWDDFTMNESLLNSALPGPTPSHLGLLSKSDLTTTDGSGKKLTPPKKVYQNREDISNHKVNKSNVTCENYVSSVKEKSNCSIEELHQDGFQDLHKYKGNAEERSERRDEKSFAKKKRTCENSNQNNSELVLLTETNTNSTNNPAQELNNKSSARNKSTKNKNSSKKKTELLTNKTSSQVNDIIKTDSKMLSPRLINSSDTLSNTGGGARKRTTLMKEEKSPIDIKRKKNQSKSKENTTQVREENQRSTRKDKPKCLKEHVRIEKYSSSVTDRDEVDENDDMWEPIGDITSQHSVFEEDNFKSGGQDKKKKRKNKEKLKIHHQRRSRRRNLLILAMKRKLKNIVIQLWAQMWEMMMSKKKRRNLLYLPKVLKKKFSIVKKGKKTAKSGKGENVNNLKPSARMSYSGWQVS